MRPFVGEHADHPSRPWRVGEHEHRCARNASGWLELPREVHVFIVAGTQACVRFGCTHEIQRIVERQHAFGELGRMEMEIVDRLTIRVVVETGAEPLEGQDCFGLESGGCPQPACDVIQPVTECCHDGPRVVAIADVGVDEKTCADVGRFVDVAHKVWMPWQCAAVVVVEVANECARVEESIDVASVLIEGDVEHGDVSTRARDHPAQQLDVALDAGDEGRPPWIDET